MTPTQERRKNGGALNNTDEEHNRAAYHYSHMSAPRAFWTDRIGLYTEQHYPEAFPHDRLKDPKLFEKH